MSDYYVGLVEERTGFLLIDALLAGDWEVFWDGVNHLILPASILGYSSLAYITRMTRSFMLDQLNQEYVDDCAGEGPVDGAARSGGTPSPISACSSSPSWRSPMAGCSKARC